MIHWCNILKMHMGRLRDKTKMKVWLTTLWLSTWTPLECHQKEVSSFIFFPIKLSILTWKPKWPLLLASFQGVEPTGARAGIQGRGENNKPRRFAILPEGQNEEQTHFNYVLWQTTVNRETLKLFKQERPQDF